MFKLSGYARVDFRVDENGGGGGGGGGRPWILEVNANPCLSPEAGFAAALSHAGISFADAMERIIGDTISRSGLAGRSPTPSAAAMA